MTSPSVSFNNENNIQYYSIVNMQGFKNNNNLSKQTIVSFESDDINFEILRVIIIN